MKGVEISLLEEMFQIADVLWSWSTISKLGYDCNI
jgi:hypothetical protein